ncbi:MAG: hypothetical protein OES47_01065 [Acidobacteriota bacterium]|nr:hypothetical protein [Acidobacteriota bacterium]
MNAVDWIGSIGVGILLLAFLLNLGRRLSATSASYQAMNVVGAGLACAAAAMIPFYPFVLLEGTWCLVALIALLRSGVRAA